MSTWGEASVVVAATLAARSSNALCDVQTQDPLQDRSVPTQTHLRFKSVWLNACAIGCSGREERSLLASALLLRHNTLSS